jgi:hypothetical protein
MLNDRDGLALYRSLEVPHESPRSWPIAKGASDEGLIPYLRSLLSRRRVGLDAYSPAWRAP